MFCRGSFQSWQSQKHLNNFKGKREHCLATFNKSTIGTRRECKHSMFTSLSFNPTNPRKRRMVLWTSVVVFTVSYSIVNLPLGNFVTSWLSGFRLMRQSRRNFEVVGSSLGTFVFSFFFLFLCHNFGFNPLYFTHNFFFTALSYENKAVATWIQRRYPFVLAANSSKNWKNVKMLPKSWLPVSWHQ